MRSGYEHRTPVTTMARAVLEEARRRNPGIGDAPVMPAPKDPFACMSRLLARGWCYQRIGSGRLSRRTGRPVPGPPGEPIGEHNWRAWDPPDPVSPMGLGRFELPTSRLSDPPRASRNQSKKSRNSNQDRTIPPSCPCGRSQSIGPKKPEICKHFRALETGPDGRRSISS